MIYRKQNKTKSYVTILARNVDPTRNVNPMSDGYWMMVSLKSDQIVINLFRSCCGKSKTFVDFVHW